MKLRLENVAVSVVEAADSELSWLRGYLSYQRAVWAGGRVDQKPTCLLNETSRSFPSGLLPLVVKAAGAAGQACEVADVRRRPCEPAQADLSWLRAYQVDAVGRAVTAGRGLIAAATGMGKAEVAIGLSLVLPCRWLFLVHRSDLMHQSAARYTLRTNADAGLVGDGLWQDASSFVAATYQTLYAGLRNGDQRARRLLASAEGLILDEVHVSGARSFLRVTQRCRRAYYRFGLSATPLASGPERDLAVIGATGPVVYRLPAAALIETGQLAKPTIRTLIVQHPTSVRELASWHDVYEACVVASTARNATVVDVVCYADKPCLLFVDQVRHGRLLEAEIRRRGVPVELVWGGDSTAERRAAFGRLERGEIDVAVITTLGKEGLDLPFLRSLVVASGGRSAVATVQRLGRGMRLSSGKTTYQVFDFTDLGHPWLERHSRARLRAYRQEGHTVTRWNAPDSDERQTALDFDRASGAERAGRG